MATKTGIDISQHQGDVGFKRVKESGMDFVICKTSEGEDFKDPTWNKGRVDAIREAKLKLGVYHFLRPRSGRTGDVEARHAVRTSKAAGWGKPGDLRLAADIEVTDLGQAETHRYLEQFVKEVFNLTGHKPMIYTFPAFWTAKMGNRGNLGCPLWIAHFEVVKPSVPSAWKGYVIHQHSSKGTVPGVSGNVDMNRAPGPLPTIPRKKPQPKPPPKPDDKVDVDMKSFQATINRFVARWLEDVPPLIIDGDKGQLTNRYIKMVKYYLGYGKTNVAITRVLVRRMRHPRNPRFTPPGMIARGVARRTKQHRQAKKERDKIKKKGIANFDGKSVPLWCVPWLEKARNRGWRGVVVSGIRTPQHSVALCQAMCGAPACPGKCAGVNSNHNATAPVVDGEGALDVSDYVKFGQEMRELGAPLRNALPRDLVHFSRSGQ